jgi:tRNA G37 N-methylase TrmD
MHGASYQVNSLVVDLSRIAQGCRLFGSSTLSAAELNIFEPENCHTVDTRPVTGTPGIVMEMKHANQIAHGTSGPGSSETVRTDVPLQGI